MRKFTYLAAVPAMIGVMALAGTAFACGPNFMHDPAQAAEHMSAMFAQQAELLGTDEETVKNAWADGKNLQELAEELGISEEDLRTRRQERMKAQQQARFDAMVSAGVISQDQADRRAAFMESRPERPEGRMGGMPFHGGPGFGRGHGGPPAGEPAE